VVISEIYAGDTEPGAVFNVDFVELFNPGGAPITLDEWNLQYVGAGGGWSIALSGTLDPGAYFLVSGVTADPAGPNTPVSDLTNSQLEMHSTFGTVSLSSSPTPALVDLVGYGNTDEYEGTAPAPVLSGPLAAIRLGAGMKDTDDNWMDFFAAAPNPQTSASPKHNQAPDLTLPVEVAITADTALAFSSLTGTGISVSDPDAGVSDVQVSLEIENGTLTLSDTSGLTFLSGDGAGDLAMSFTGSLSDVNDSLDGLVYFPEYGYRGAANLGITIDDLGNSGVGGARWSLGRTRIVVGGPIVAVEDLVTTREDTSITVDVRRNDAWSDTLHPSLVIVTQPTHGSVEIDGSETASPIDDRIWYSPAAEYHGLDSFTYSLTDGMGNSSTAGVQVTIDLVNDARIAWDGLDLSNVEGDGIEVLFETPDATSAVIWSASGLPAGLTLNSLTGSITGIIQNELPGPNDPYHVVLTTEASGGDTHATMFDWYVSSEATQPPAFAEATYTATVGMGAPQGTLVTKITATDADNDKIKYFIKTDTSGLFTIDITTGQIKVAPQKRIPLELTTFEVTIEAKSDRQGEASDTAKVNITTKTVVALSGDLQAVEGEADIARVVVTRLIASATSLDVKLLLVWNGAGDTKGKIAAADLRAVNADAAKNETDFGSIVWGAGGIATITIPANKSAVEILIGAKRDALVEGDEVLTLELQAGPAHKKSPKLARWVIWMFLDAFKNLRKTRVFRY